VPLSFRQLPADYDAPFGQGPMRDGPDLQARYAEAKKLVAAAKKEEFKLPPHGPEKVWQAPSGPKPELAQLVAWRQMLEAKPSPSVRDAQAKATQGLLGYEPGPFFKELVAWEAMPKRNVSSAEFYYPKASEYAWRCGQDREKNLRLLLDAKEPVVRVVGAVYLCFENEKAGIAELGKLTQIPDEPGAWAALTLARRGQKNAVPRMLEVFKGNPRGRFYTNLRFRAQVLLSNSAQKSGVPQPPRADPMRPWGDEVDFADFQAWWQQHEARITLHDPWLAMLSKQKIDQGRLNPHFRRRLSAFSAFPLKICIVPLVRGLFILLEQIQESILVFLEKPQPIQFLL
jgi:hypothetical protein